MSQKSFISLLYRVLFGRSKWLSGHVHSAPQNFPLYGCHPDAHSRESKCLHSMAPVWTRRPETQFLELFKCFIAFSWHLINHNHLITLIYTLNTYLISQILHMASEGYITKLSLKCGCKCSVSKRWFQMRKKNLF
jgi:hypothetical protein